MKIEIFERSSSDVVETLEVESMTAFRHYWDAQANKAEYGFRILGVATARVLKEADCHHVHHDRREFLPFNEDTCAVIAKSNENMTDREVYHALLDGKTIYTNFSRYSLEA